MRKSQLWTLASAASLAMVSTLLDCETLKLASGDFDTQVLRPIASIKALLCVCC